MNAFQGLAQQQLAPPSRSKTAPINALGTVAAVDDQGQAVAGLPVNTNRSKANKFPSAYRVR